MTKRQNKFIHILLRIPALTAIAVNWFLSSRQSATLPSFEHSDKALHFICYSGFSFCWCLWFSRRSWKAVPARCICTSAALASAYAVIDELHQHFVPGRSCSFADWAADTAGAVFGSCAAYVLFKLIFSNKTSGSV